MEVFPTTGGVSVYANNEGSVSIKQEDMYGGDSSLIVIPLIHVEAVVKALRQAKRDALRE